MTDIGLEWGKPISNLEEKQKIAVRMAGMVQNGQTIGAGSGSTSFLTVLAIGERCRQENLKIRIVPSSIEIQWACEASGLEIAPLGPVAWCFDGADEVDANNRLIKGRGGAMHRERKIFEVAKKIYVIADHSKTVTRLGEKFPVPVEAEPNHARALHQNLSQRKNVNKVQLRHAIAKDGPAVTESGCVILDVWYDLIPDNEHADLMKLPGVRDTGIFSGFDIERIS